MAYTPAWKDEQTDLLVRAVLNLKDEEEVYRLLDDLCTVYEIKALAQRLQIAWLLNGNVTYNSLVETTGASTATISRVKKCWLYGADGYRRILDRLDGEVEHEK